MTVYLIRHGQDDPSVRGGWSMASLNSLGIRQVRSLTKRLSSHEISAVYSSDLPRAMETAKPLAEARQLQVIPVPEFRETNNGLLAGMKHEEADRLYPNLYWNRLEWNQPYPEGESPHQFFVRIEAAWKAFKQEIAGQDGNVALVTHAGVIQVILSIEAGRRWSNRNRFLPIRCATYIPIKIKNFPPADPEDTEKARQ